LAGLWFLVAGLGMVTPSVLAVLPNTFLNSMNNYTGLGVMLLGAVISSAAALVGSVAAYVVLLRAGFPHRSPPMTLLTVGLAVVSPLAAAAGFGFLLGDLLRAVTDVITLIGCALLLVFAIAAARNRLLPLGFRIVPGAQFVLALIGFLTSHATPLPVAGIPFIAAGAAYVILASHAAAALEAAAIATPQERSGRPRPPSRVSADAE
jgi:hypothetical protein